MSGVVDKCSRCLPQLLLPGFWESSKSTDNYRSAEPRHRLTSAPIDVSLLGQPIHFKNGLTAKNRFMKSAMSERVSLLQAFRSNSFSNFDRHRCFQMGEFDARSKKDRGMPTSCLIRLYEKFGAGDYGVIVTGNIPVSSVGSSQGEKYAGMARSTG